MTPEQEKNWKTTLAVSELVVKQTKRNYQTGKSGFTDEDVRKAAARLLTLRGMYEKESGRPVRSKPTKSQIAGLIRGI